MTTKSWSVTLTTLIIAILQIVEIKASGRTPTPADMQMLYASIAAFIGSGVIGMLAKTLKK